MCTVTWLERDGGYELFCNRDELRSRRAARPPHAHTGPVGRYLAPIDPDGGGSWIAVNDRGLGLTLLNDYASDPGSGEFESRGRLVTALTAEVGVAAVAARLPQAALERYRPFRLLALAPGEAARVFHWDGRRAAVEETGELPLLTSSSYDPAAADRARRELLSELAGPGLADEVLASFHRSHRPGRGPLSPCMHRADARTVSFTHLVVGEEEARMVYLDGAPCAAAAGAGQPLSLPLVDRRVTAGA